MRVLAGVCLGAVLAAQGPQTFVVDVANGPGTHFTQIQAAVAAVPDGSILRVRPGLYGLVQIQAKGLTILCDPGVTAGPGYFLFIQDTSPGQAVVVRGLGQAAAGQTLRVDNAQGPVVIDGAGASIVHTHGYPPAILRSRQVVLQRWAITSAYGFLVGDSRVVLEECSLVGGNGYVSTELGWVAPYAALLAINSELQLVHGSARGGNGGTYVFNRPGAPAVSLVSGSRLRVVGLATHSLVGGSSPALGAHSAIEGNGTARVDPAVVMTGTPLVGPGIVLSLQVMPSLVTQDASPGGTLIAHRYGAVGSIFVVALGLPGPVAILPGIADPLWFDASRFCIEAVGVGTASGPFVVQRPVPNQPGLIGVNLVWQAADLHATGSLELGNPSPTGIR